METLGIDEVKQVMALGFALGELIEALGDGIGISDIGVLVGVVRKAPPAMTALKSGKVIPELKDLSDAEKADIVQFTKDNFTLKDKSVEQAIDIAIGIAVDLTDLLKLFA